MLVLSPHHSNDCEHLVDLCHVFVVCFRALHVCCSVGRRMRIQSKLADSVHLTILVSVAVCFLLCSGKDVSGAILLRASQKACVLHCFPLEWFGRSRTDAANSCIFLLRSDLLVLFKCLDTVGWHKGHPPCTDPVPCAVECCYRDKRDMFDISTVWYRNKMTSSLNTACGGL